MIIDDELVICGSANINDRSMTGARDSEFCVLIKAPKNLDSKIDNIPSKVSKFAKDFRLKLLAEHLGLKKNDSLISDPLSDELHFFVVNRARSNTEIYRKIFGCYPDDLYTNFSKLKQRKNMESDENLSELKRIYKENHKNIKGHIVEFPLHFLEEEQLGISFFSVENLVPERNFT